ncbi:unnamed protein product [Plutella xylostella]|uniref:(diamondback moth) hypothetical protein n=1 Tax=Plutella xylostella TaxID=51655 RepID=A0A8S4G9J7_PLUXY|nr:unnamed protein product [Plutella xylostella]
MDFHFMLDKSPMSESSTPGWALAWRVLTALETGALAGAAAAALAGLARRGPALPPPKSVVDAGEEIDCEGDLETGSAYRTGSAAASVIIDTSP